MGGTHGFVETFPVHRSDVQYGKNTTLNVLNNGLTRLLALSNPFSGRVSSQFEDETSLEERCSHVARS